MALKLTNPIGKRREKQKAETYALILESARYLFETKGFKKTTIRAVASHAEIGIGTIYKHFKNKTSLLAAAFYDDLIRLFEEAVQSLPENEPLQEQFIHLVGFNCRYYCSRLFLSREYLHHIAFADAEWLEKFEAFEKSYLNRVKELVDAAQQRGEIAPEKDNHFVAVSFMADYFFVLNDLFLRQNINSPDQILSFLRKMLDQIVC
jgi:AcrR family transcriptional regulator